jgi:LEA14-like dessication related protein
MRTVHGWIAAGALLVLGACAGLPLGMEPLSVTLADVRPSQMGLLEQEFMMKIRVQNPNNVEVPLQGVAFSVELNGKNFAKGVSRQDGTVPAFGDVVLDVKAISTLGDVLNQVGALRDGPPGKITYRLHGKLAPAGGGSLPFDSIGSIDLSALTGESAK